MIYFVQSASTTLIKVGFTNNRGARLKTLQSLNGGDLRLLGGARGGRTEEAALHRRFAHLRHHGEWFRPGEELLAFIGQASAACAPAPRPVNPPRQMASSREPYRVVPGEAPPAGDPLRAALLRRFLAGIEDPDVRGWVRALLGRGSSAAGGALKRKD